MFTLTVSWVKITPLAYINCGLEVTNRVFPAVRFVGQLGNVLMLAGGVWLLWLLDRRGGVQADLTVTRLAEERFLLVTGTAYGNHDVGWLRSHLPDDGSAEVRDTSEGPGRCR